MNYNDIRGIMVKILRKAYINFKNIDKGLFISSLILATLGIIMVLTSSSIFAGLSAESNYNSFYYVTKQAVAIIASLIGCSFALAIIKSDDYDLFAVIGMVLCAIMSAGKLIQGQITSGIAEVTLDLGFTTIQPAEFFKILFVVYLGC